MFGSSTKRHTQRLAKTCPLSCLFKQLIQDNYCSLQKALQASQWKHCNIVITFQYGNAERQNIIFILSLPQFLVWPWIWTIKYITSVMHAWVLYVCMYATPLAVNTKQSGSGFTDIALTCMYRCLVILQLSTHVKWHGLNSVHFHQHIYRHRISFHFRNVHQDYQSSSLYIW